MPPTLKDSSTLSASAEKPESGSRTPAGSEEVSSAQPVALEVPVTVNGARAVEGSEKREPFSETTSTVLVLANGAVIRLASSVAPGQLLFLTNEKTKKEVVCQVVKSKNYRSASGYVELEFTEPVLGFWGMRFPGERHTTLASQTTLAGSTPPATRKSDVGGLTAAIPPKSPEDKPIPYAEARPAAESVTANLADAVQEFKTEIKADSRPSSKADVLAPAEPSIDGLKLEANRLQEQLSSLLFAEQKQSEGKTAGSMAPPSRQELGDAAAKIFDIANEPPAALKVEPPSKSVISSSTSAAPKDSRAPLKSSFDSEETKIPAWLEPLARNAAGHAPPAQEGADGYGSQFEERHSSSATEPVSSPKHAAEPARQVAKNVTAAPLFENSLLRSTPEPSRSQGSSKTVWMAIAAGLVIVAGGAWYFRESLGLSSPAHTTQASRTLPSAPTSSRPVAPSNSASLETSTLTTATTDISSPAAKGSSANLATETSASIAGPGQGSTPNQGKVQAAAITERIPKSTGSNDLMKAAAKSPEVIEPEIKKPSLGAVRLAKPKVGRAASAQPNAEIEPALEISHDALSTRENTLSTNFAESSKQPAVPSVPVQVGGDVKPARMISSVAPVYPSLARTQRVSGNVRIDALIEANGRVTTMKVVSGPSLLHQAAMESLRQWKYQPAMLDGKPVPMHLTVTIQFRLQ